MYVSKISNFIPQFKTNNNQTNPISYSNGLTMASPLLKDTVSFQGTPKQADKAWNTSIKDAKAIRRSLREAYKKVNRFMDDTFGDLVASEKYPKNPIYLIDTRLKSDFSISDKSGTRKWTSIDEILESMTDLIGAKIVMRDSNKSTVDAVLDRFIPLIKSRKIELIEIENKRPGIVEGLDDKEAAKYDYASLAFLRKMINIQEEVWKNSQKGGKRPKVKQRLEDDFTDANYCAIHFLFKLTGRNSSVFELQLIGKDNNEAKHIDDVVWKKLNRKSSSEDCPEIDKIFEPFTNPKFFEAEGEEKAKEIVKNAEDKLNEYRGEMFIFQRQKEPMLYSKKKKPEIFLPLRYNLFPDDIELKYGISSSDFDYNNLYGIWLKNRRKKAAATKKNKTAQKV